MPFSRTHYLSLMSMAIFAGVLLLNPLSSSAQFPDTIQADEPRLSRLFADDAGELVPAPDPGGAVPPLFSQDGGTELAYDATGEGPCPDCFAVEGESWLDWHGVPEVFEHPDDNPGFELSSHQEHELPEEHPTFAWSIWERWMELLEKPHEPFVEISELITGAEHDGTVFTDPDYSWTSDRAIGVQPIMDRPPLIIEYPLKFLGQGTIPEGYELPTGAIWRPTLWVFGSNRFGVSYRDDQAGAGQIGANFGSFVNRLAIFAQLNFTGTERIQIGIRPTDEEEGRPLLFGREYTSYFWKQYTALPGGVRRTIDGLDGWNGDLNVAYFEGQLDEIFPGLDPYDTEFLDLGFSVGRQAMSFQRGLMLNEDMIDAVTVTRNTLFGGGNLNLRMTGVFAWNRLTRVSPFQNTDAKLYGLFTESDFKFNTVNVDIGFVNDPNRDNRDVIVAAVSSTQRLVGYHNTYNSRFHVLASFPTEGEGIRTGFMGSPGNATGQGELFFAQISVTPHRSEDLIYWNTFLVVDQFTSLARAPQAGPLGDTGLLFAAAGLGLYGPPLATVTNSAVGTSIGYQIFLDTKNQQIIYEIGAREGKGADEFEIGGVVQYQRAIAQNWIWLVTGFMTSRHGTDGLSHGLRSEIQLFF